MAFGAFTGLSSGSGKPTVNLWDGSGKCYGADFFHRSSSGSGSATFIKWLLTPRCFFSPKEQRFY